MLVFPVHPKEGENLEDAPPQQLSVAISRSADQPTHDREREQDLCNTLSRLLSGEVGHRRFHSWTHAGYARLRRAHRATVRRAKRSKLGDNCNAVEGGER